MSDKITKYLVSTFLCSWLMWGLVALGGELGFSWLQFGSPIGMILYVFGGISPAICEIIIQKKDCSKEEFKSFLGSIVNPRYSFWLYLYAIGGAIVIQGIPVLIGYSTIKQPFYIGFVLILPMVIGGGLEEIGWRGLLQPELEKKVSHFSATFVVGVIWSLWHIPLWFIDGTNQQNIDFLWFCINAFTLSFFIGSVRYISGSILLSILTHATINAFWEVMPSTNEILPSLVILVLIGVLSLIIDYAVVKRKSILSK
ncbi:MAG: family intrarane metalloprotease [Herbinix sp.]|jgi:membrane protease YdiL (CAAX protease family)|nr:family intrarane metalloprotease [Herbinix sp.]